MVFPHDEPLAGRDMKKVCMIKVNVFQEQDIFKKVFKEFSKFINDLNFGNFAEDFCFEIVLFLKLLSLSQKRNTSGLPERI